jgi:hypothetical protein
VDKEEAQIRVSTKEDLNKGIITTSSSLALILEEDLTPETLQATQART